MATQTDLPWYPGADLTIRFSPTIDGVPSTGGATLYLSAGNSVPIADRTDATQYVSVDGDDLVAELPAALRDDHTWYRLDVAPAGRKTIVAFGRLNHKSA